ncbi:peptide/nickel transport system permease protein [Nocardioides daedukensis]|uniref:Peptide/nickel transport system permease protein n=1 Tax=Nocardioides daedukensis TaxID=634462 RepID=A0A7Y9S4C1_9ACTN|nr:ABC transporter permease [Nocardioides daedukensis]NYG59858.1 peptide/nickel transport system permease protein [Nocardioides daedukensis]
MAIIEAPAPENKTPQRRGLKRSKQSRTPWFSILAMGTFAVCGIFGSFIAPHDPTTNDLGNSLVPPFWAEGGSTTYLLGTDQLGRDILSRLLSGAQVSFLVAVAAVLIAGAIGLGVALLAGYVGGRLDAFLTRVADSAMAFPVLLLAVIVVALYGKSITIVIIVLVLAVWPQYARVLRSEVIRIRNEDYVVMSKVMGGSGRWAIVRHILPNVVPTLLVLATLQIGFAIIAEGSLSFLGIGVPAPAASWGNMLADGRNFMQTAWWVPVFPGIALSITVLSANLLGDWLRQTLDPATRR